MAKDKPKYKSNTQIFVEYLNFGTQLGLMLFVAVWGGKKLDEKLHLSFPLLVWLFPLIVIAGMFIKLFRDTAKKKTENE
ncbi:AtpZ/AtpI family protein [Haoranjiania flava]|uniref:AtpZ/AtpI family protein n=1 Tax=Haoranjiania flava TaxID=1856322 RepID=A0AAE3LMD5_9BACT|nr:AtpZ/AtpI family protein [Haoranjiania flava]MCU7693746.1 AtpZ/AtpI family protein [Haoranjiania flava]